MICNKCNKGEIQTSTAGDIDFFGCNKCGHGWIVENGKKYIRQGLDAFSFNESSDLGTFTLDDAINYLEKIKSLHPEANQFYLRVEKNHYDDLNCFVVEMERLETDKEYNKRTKTSQKEKKNKKKQNKKLLKEKNSQD